MANTVLTPQIIAVQALRILQAHILFRDLCFNDYSKEFAKVGDTVTVRKRNPIKSTIYDGQKVIKKNIKEDPVAVKLDRIRDTTVMISSKDMTLSIQDFSQQVLEPVLIGLAQDIDNDIAAAITGFASAVVPSTETPTDLSDIAKLANKMDNNKVPTTDRNLVFCPDHKYKYALTENLSNVAYAGDNMTLREALLGRVYGFNTYMSQNCVKSNSATKGTATAYKVAGTVGSTDTEGNVTQTVALSNVTPATATIKKGEGFIVDGRLYRFTEDLTAASGAIASAKIDNVLHREIKADDEITLINCNTSVAFHKEAVAFVTRPLEQPAGAPKSYVAQADNISVRAVWKYDQDLKSDVISFDVLYGIAPLNKDMIIRLN